MIKQLCTPGVPQSVLPPKPIAPDAFEDEHSSEGLRGRILYVQIHTWWHLSARMLDSESELWTEDAPGWRSEDSRTAVKLCFHKSSAAQFPTNPTEFILTNPLICVLRSLHLESDILSPRCHRVWILQMKTSARILAHICFLLIFFATKLKMNARIWGKT